MRKGHLQARLYLGDRTELIATNDDKARLVVLLSSRLEKEKLDATGDIVDIELNEVVYWCCRSVHVPKN